MPPGPAAMLGPYEILAPWAREAWAKSIARATRAWDGKSRSRSCRTRWPLRSPSGSPASSAKAQSLASLNHANIAAIYGLEEAGRRAALVMELVEGQTLAERLDAGPHSGRRGPVRRACRSPRPSKTAHDARHRPSGPEARQREADGRRHGEGAGLRPGQGARRARPAAIHRRTRALTDDDAQRTRSGHDPGDGGLHVARSRRAGKTWTSARTSGPSACVLYEMLTGGRLFAGETVSDVLASVLRQEIDWKALPPPVPPSCGGCSLAASSATRRTGFTTSRTCGSRSTTCWPERIAMSSRWSLPRSQRWSRRLAIGATCAALRQGRSRATGRRGVVKPMRRPGCGSSG